MLKVIHSIKHSGSCTGNAQVMYTFADKKPSRESTYMDFYTVHLKCILTQNPFPL